MICNYSYDDLTAYFDGELPPDYSRELAAHVGHCPDCSAVMKELRCMRDMLFRAGREEFEAPADLKDSIMASLRLEGAFGEKAAKGGRISSMVSGSMWGSTINRGIAAAVGALLVGGATWAGFTGNLVRQVPSVANSDPPPAVSEKYSPIITATNGSGTAIAPDPLVQGSSGGNAGGELINNSPVTPPESNQAQENPISEKPRAIAQANNRLPSSAMFLSLSKVCYSGFLQVSKSAASNQLSSVSTLAVKYSGTVSGSDTGIIRIDVPTSNYQALFGEMEAYFRGKGQLINSGSTEEDLNSAYRETLIELEQVIKSRDQLEAGQAEQISLLEKKENSLNKKLEGLELKLKTSTIVVKL